MVADISLKRSLGLVLVTSYGLGTIIGAGIYVLVSEMARVSGAQMPWAFLTAGLIAALTGACYAELCTRFPQAAGAVNYIDRVFGNRSLSIISGALLLATGVVSAATISRGFVGYLDLYVEIPDNAAILGLCLVMGVVTSLGVRDSAIVIAAITLLELGGLLLVIALTDGEPRELVMPMSPGAILLGAFLAFYAFIGFEDMVNLAEEVQEPERVLPKAILMAIGGACLLYLLVAFAAVRFVDLEQLARSQSPLALMIGDYPNARQLLAAIGVVAISNGALTQIIMGSRVMYGMGRRGLLPGLFSRVSRLTHTPVINTWILVTAIAAFALFLPVATLARITSAIMLLIFMLVNLALISVHRRPGPAPAFRTWAWIPWLSLFVNGALLVHQLHAIVTHAQG